MTKPRPHPARPQQPGYRPQPQPPKRKSWPARSWRAARDPWILLGVVLVLGGCVVFVLAANNGQQAAPETLATATPARPALPSPQPPPPPPPPAPLRPLPPPAPATIVYEVAGDASSTTYITYAVDEKANLAQVRGEALPWSVDVDFPHGVFGPTLSLVAQSASSGSEEITCRILWDDEVVAESSARGPYAVVTCVGPVQPPPGRS